MVALALLLTGCGGGERRGAPDSATYDPQAVIAQPDEAPIYTCSMHPSIRQPEPGTCPICGMDLVPATSLQGSIGELSAADSWNGSRRGAGTSPVRLTTVRRMTMERVWSGPGILRADPSRDQVVSLDAPATVVQAGRWIEGDVVRRGDTLLWIESPDLTRAARDLALLSSNDPIPAGDRLIADDLARRIRRAGLSDDQIDGLRAGRLSGDTLRIVSPIDGIVISKRASNQQTAAPGLDFYVLNDLAEMIADVELLDIAPEHVRPGDKVEIRPLAGSARELPGTVQSMRPRQSGAGYVVGIRVRVPNPDGRLREGMRIEAVGGAPVQTNGLFVPITSVLWTGDDSWVFRRHDGHLEPVAVRLGERVGESVQITDGLLEGDEIALHGTFLLDSSEQLSGALSRFASVGPEPVEEPARLRLSVQSIQPVLAAYGRLRSTLVASSREEASTAWTDLLDVLDRLQTGHAGSLTRPQESLSLDHIRAEFKLLSEQLIRGLRALPPDSVDRLYVHRCPMAFGNRGASWVSADSSIVNPYFGDAMLTCGETIDRLGTPSRDQ